MEDEQHNALYLERNQNKRILSYLKCNQLIKENHIHKKLKGVRREIRKEKNINM